jgi:hypothetical protein
MNKKNFDPSRYPDLHLITQIKSSGALAKKKNKTKEPPLRLKASRYQKRMLHIEREEFRGYEFETVTICPQL